MASLAARAASRPVLARATTRAARGGKVSSVLHFYDAAPHRGRMPAPAADLMSVCSTLMMC
jgi:hypothetical protein